MAYAYQIYPALRFGRVTFTGTVNGASIREAMTSLFNDARWEPGFDVLWDGRKVQRLLLEMKDVQEIADLTGMLREEMGEGRAAVITTRDVDYMSGQLLLARSRRRPGRVVRFFERIEEALAWLGIPQAALRDSDS
jgi:hypothetical protein